MQLLRRSGITDVTLAVNYLAHMIEDCIGDGRELGMRVSYQREKRPLGTAGALAELERFQDSVLLMNGDLITDIDIPRMLDCHRAHRAVMTVASKVMYTDLSLGVLDVRDDGLIARYLEKPRLEHRFGIGVYLVEPAVRQFVAPGQRVDMPDLINRLLIDNGRVAYYDHEGEWVDIGEPEDYARVLENSGALEMDSAAAAAGA